MESRVEKLIGTIERNKVNPLADDVMALVIYLRIS